MTKLRKMAIALLALGLSSATVVGLLVDSGATEQEARQAVARTPAERLAEPGQPSIRSQQIGVAVLSENVQGVAEVVAHVYCDDLADAGVNEQYTTCLASNRLAFATRLCTIATGEEVGRAFRDRFTPSMMSALQSALVDARQNHVRVFFRVHSDDDNWRQWLASGPEQVVNGPPRLPAVKECEETP